MACREKQLSAAGIHPVPLLGRMEDGDFLLGVPGRENGEDERAAAAFGFPEFLKGSSKETGEQEFGYWCRRFRL